MVKKKWWIHGIPKKIQKDCADNKIDLASEEPEWRFLNTIHYLDIIKQNWDSLGEVFTYPGTESSGKEKRLSWIKDFNLIRQKYSHPQRESVSENEYMFLEKINFWLKQSLNPR